MTILTSESGISEEVTVRRTESLDVSDISNLKTVSTQQVFGNVNVIYLLEKSNLAVTISDEKNNVIAHASFLDYPNWDVTDQAEWEDWMYKNYQETDKCTPLNTLFLHLFVSEDEFSLQSIKEIMRAVFKAVADLHFICLVTPHKVTLTPALASVFEPVRYTPGSRFTEEFSMYICHRHKHCPQLHIRKARVEDHDDLIPIFLRHNDTLKSTYGEYFLAELINAQDEHNHAVVCEDQGCAVGFMSVCSEVNVKLLQDSFDLGPFHGLCKPHPDDILQKPHPDDVLQATEEPGSVEGDLMLSRQASQRSGSKLSQLSDVISVPETDKKEKGTLSRASSTDDAIRGVNCKTPETPSTEVERQPFRPVYKGDVTAFCIQLFCIDEKHETRSFDFLSHIFGLFPDKDFCIITVPHLTPEFPLLQSFVRAVPLSTCTLPQELYIFHRAGLINLLRVRAAKSSDVPAVEKLIESLHLHDSILDDLRIYNEARRDADGTPVQAFVAEVADQIVGIAIMRNEEDIEYIRSHYNIEDFIYFNHHQRDEHGHFHHYALNPIFKLYSKHFLKEILRLSHKSSLYYPVYPPYDQNQFKNPCAHSLTSALHYMVPVRPRRQIVYPLEKLGINAPSKQVSKDQPAYALYHINRKLTLEPKVTINARIVVVGASDVGISFLETLVFCPHLKFNNITLISTHGLPGNNGCMDQSLLASSHYYNDKDYALMSLRSWVNVVVGKMTGIDRAAKFVIVSNDRKVPYDHLILCTGQQYQVPCPSGADINKLLTNQDIPDCSKQIYTGKIPSNLFTLNDGKDCITAINWLKDNVVNQKGNLIVYGNTLDSYTTVATFMSLGICGSRIHFVQPPLTSNVTCFNNYAIEEAVHKGLLSAGVTTYYNCKLAQWNDGADPDPIYCASFTTDSKPLKLSCTAFFNFFDKKVDYDAFKAMNSACLVYDGRLVIDTTFHTNDSSIRAAGPLTKYSSKYYVNEWSHSNFSSKEIGVQLAAAMLPLFDPTLEPMSEPLQECDRLIPIYKGPTIQGGLVPGGYYYLHVAKPAIPSPLQAQMVQPNHGQEIITGKALNGDYFRLHINQYSMVEAITCLSLKPIPTSNLICLYGQHERLLKNLCSRFKEGLVQDLYSYFMEAWCMAVYHDRFIDFRQEVHDQPSMKELVQKVTGDELNLAETPQKYLRRVLEQNGYKQDIEKRILNYLHFNSNHLSMFARPGIV
ncbi:cilia- and flagella-associated protein 61 isoform X2 [Hyla sarda]|uniref:cilia- and flagella-associated protein 61 isoform X2 n=1 Tax=Hyla sarda TaxID=327740 RepID=UPI0024C43E56|nr:cilia- and flagella-associated protein 61 isoform X2 [Hyla sarda]